MASARQAAAIRCTAANIAAANDCRARSQDETSRRSLSVKMTVRGGLPSQKYSFEFAASGDGAAICRFEDQLRKRKRRWKWQLTALSDKEFVAASEEAPAGSQASHRAVPSFLPDTLVGILEISDGSVVRRIYFAADPEQAKTQGKVPPREVLQAVEAVYAAGASAIGQ